MNWDQAAGKWKQVQGKIKEKWGDLTDDDLTVAAGGRDQFVGLLQERYGFAKEDAEKQIDAFVNSLQNEAKDRYDRPDRKTAKAGARN